MTRTLKVLIGAAALAIFGVSTASAQTGPLLGRELYLFDGGSGTTQNTVRLLAPPADTITNSWTFTLPRNQGGTNFIMVNKDGLGTTEWEDGLSLFWGIEGNCDPIVPWNGTTGNYIGHCLNNIDFRSGDSFMNYWFNDQTSPRMTLDSNGRLVLNVIDGSEGLVIYGQGPNGPDAGLVLDCANPPTVGIEVNALATGILMPTCATAPLVGISIQAQTTGLEIDSSGNTGILISESLTGINVTGTNHSINATGTVRLNTVAADASATQVLARNGSNDVVYRAIAATGTIVTTPSGGTVNYLPLWSPSTTELGTSLISQDFPATTATVNGHLTITGTTVDISNVPTTAGMDNILVRNATGDIEVSNAEFVSLPNGTTPSNGQILIGNGTTFVLNTINADAGITVTNGAGTIELDVDNPVPAGTTNNSTLRWNTATLEWQENTNLLSSAAGNTTNNGTLTLSVANTVLDASDTRILTQDAGTGLVGHRTVAATGDIVTAPIAGTTGRITRWTASNQIGDGSLDDNGIGTLSRTGNIAINPGAAATLSTNGNMSVSGTMTISTVAADATDVRLLSIDAGTGLVSYRTVPANGDIVTSNGALGNNSAVTTNGTGQLVTTAMTNGQLMIGSTGGAPVFTTLTAGTGISITNAAGSITINASGELLPSGPNTTDATLRWDGSDWVQNVNLLSTAAGNTTINGTATMNGTVTVDVADIALDAANTRLLSIDGASGLVGYRDVPANGTIVTSSGALGNNSAVTTNGSGQLVTTAMTDGQIMIGSTGLAPSFATLTAGTGISITNGAGTITIATSNEQLPNGTTNHATLRWNGTDWVENTLFRADNAGGLFNNSLTAGANTDNLLTIDAAGNFHETTVATMIGGTPWILGGNTTGVTGANNILGINYASGETLELFVEGFQAAEFAITGALTQNFDFTARENVTMGDADDDNHAIRGDLDVNTTNASALSVNINTSAFANVTTIGSNTAGNVINLDAPDVSLLPSIPVYTIGSAPGTHSFIGIDLATGQIKRSSFPVSYTNYGLRYDGTELVRTVMTDDGTNVAIQQTGTLSLASSAAGNVTVGFDDGLENGSGTNTTNLNSELIYAPNLPANNSTNFILVYDNATGQIAKKDLGAPIQKVKSGTATITGAPPTRIFSIADTFIAVGATVTVTLQDGSDVNDYTVTLPAASITAGVGFTIRLSGVMGAGNTKTVHYTITNP